MVAFLLLFMLAYFAASFLLTGYSLLGLCIRPLARTSGFAAGQLLLTAFLLLCAVALGGWFMASAVISDFHLKWRGWSSVQTALETLPLGAMLALPFCLCWRAVNHRPMVVFAVACGCVGCCCWIFFGGIAGA